MTQTLSTPPPQSPASAGLEGVVAAKSDICFINGIAGRLVYRGYEIGDLVENTTFEEVAYLLWEGKLPNRAELADLKQAARRRRWRCRSMCCELLEALPAQDRADGRAAHGRQCARRDRSGSAQQRARRQSPQGHPADRAVPDDRHGVPSPAQRRSSRSRPIRRSRIAANFLYMLNGKKPHDTLTRVMDAALVLHAEHGMNASTFAARVTAATLADMHAAVTAAVAALKGPLHGGANQDVMELLLECGDAETAEKQGPRDARQRQKIPASAIASTAPSTRAPRSSAR